MDHHHLVNALLDSISDVIADKVAQRLALRPPVKAVERSLVAVPADPSAEPMTAPEGASEYLTTKEAAELLGVSIGGLEGMRANGTGPKYVKIGRRVRYRRDALK